MSGTKKHFVFAYSLLVVLPLFLLAGILHTGRNLTAPPAIDGLWNLQLDPSQDSSSSCVNIPALIPDQRISISQSGKDLIFGVPSAPTITAAGTIEGKMIHASLTSPGHSGNAACASLHRFTLLATINRQANGSFLTGTVASPDCPTCAPVAFRAQHYSAAP
ncbi:MAG: hypothetical protein WA824_09785 [Candidatus Sulfotelmatobacter sp.]